MKAKTIKQVLAKKHEDWVKSIDDKELRALVRKNTIITGGCIASLLCAEKVNDYDIYFTDKDTVIKACNYYIAKFQELNPHGSDQGCETSQDIAKPSMKINLLVEEDRVKIRINTRDARPACEPGYSFDEGPDQDDPKEEFEDIEPAAIEPTDNPFKPKYRPVYLSANAITLSDKIQIVIRFFGDAATIHENYDFNHCKCYWTSKDHELVLPAFALEALLTKELVYTGSKYPLASIIRTRKFIKRGFTCNAGQYLKMCLQLNHYDLMDIRVLEDQLIGMDAVYFAQLLAAIPADKVVDNKIDSHYLFTLINRFF